MASLNKIWLVIRREYTTRVLKKSFVILTLLMPFLMALTVIVPTLLMTMQGNSREVIAVIDRTGQYTKLFEDSEQYTFVPADAPLSHYRGAGKEQEITAVLEIRQDLLEDPNAISLFSFKTLPSAVEEYINRQLSTHLSEQKIDSYDIPALREIIRSSKVNISVATYKWSETGAETASSSSIANGIGMVLNFVIYMFIMIYGMMVLQSVMEEKKSRIMEVMVSCVRPFELMMGKIIGIGLVGLTQIFFWIILGSAIMFGAQLFFFGDLYSEEAVAQMQTTGRMSPSDMEWVANLFSSLESINFIELALLFIAFFIGGYLLYAALLAAFGSAVSNEEDSNQVVMPVTILMILSSYIGLACMNNPEGSLALWASFIPFTSPIVMMARLPYGVPIWQEFLSLLILYLSFVGLTLLGGKIYRVGILMYGKKPSLKEMWQWLRYK